VLRTLLVVLLAVSLIGSAFIGCGKGQDEDGDSTGVVKPEDRPEGWEELAGEQPEPTDEQPEGAETTE
jgi:hypothetical protein